jgi:hypothetical protein
MTKPNGTAKGGCGGSVSTTANPFLMGGGAIAMAIGAVAGTSVGKKRKNGEE